MSMTSPSAGPGGARPGPRRRPGEFGGGGGGGRKFTPRRKVCQFCVDKIKEVDYKDLGRLRRFCPTAPRLNRAARLAPALPISVR